MSAPVIGATHEPCCSAHGLSMTCARYRRTHFVEVRPCCAVDAAAMKVESEARFETEVMAGPIVDMIGDGRMEYDGPRCDGEDCGTPVDDDAPFCDDCAEAITCPSCLGNGGWPQSDGLIVECPRGCMTDGAA